jgi:assimilatory nitrate reductase catalytic subunit
MMETEPVVCARFGVGIDCIRGAITSGSAGTVAEIGKLTRAGTNCGSCLPELKRIVAQERAKARAAAPMTEPAA